MKKEKMNPIILAANIVCAVVLIAMVAVLFLPAWQFEDGVISIASYIGFPTKKIALLKGFKATLGLAKTPGVNDVVTIPVCVMLVVIVGEVFALLSKKISVASLITLFAGVLGLVGYITVPFFALASSYMLLLVVSAIAIVVGLAGTVLSVIVFIKNEKAIRAAM